MPSSFLGFRVSGFPFSKPKSRKNGTLTNYDRGNQGSDTVWLGIATRLLECRGEGSGLGFRFTVLGQGFRVVTRASFGV